jgi:hypothetical protein
VIAQGLSGRENLVFWKLVILPPPLAKMSASPASEATVLSGSRDELTRSAFELRDVEASVRAHKATKGAVEKHKAYVPY